MMRPAKSNRSGSFPSWNVLLDGPLRDRALAAIEDIAQALVSPPQAWVPDFNAEPFRISRGISLGSGSPALAMFYAYYDRSFRSGSTHAELISKYIAYTGAGLEVVRLEPGFMFGLSGALWALDHIATLTGDPVIDLAEAMVEADSFLAGHDLDEEGFDMWFGLTGYGIYALSRAAEPSARRLLNSLVERLVSAVDPDPEEAPWVVRPTLLKKPDRAGIPFPHTRLGVAHGVAGVVAFLAEAHLQDLGGGRIPSVCDRVWRWLDAQKAQDDRGTFWPNVTAPGSEFMRKTEKWCHGMPGISAALLSASRKIGHAEMEAWSIARAREMAESTRQGAQPIEASLCHGSTCLGHIYNRIFQQSGDELFADAARFNLQLTLDLQTPGRGVGGFVGYGPGPTGDYGDLFDPGLMVGSSGIGLALLAAVSDQVPHWDRALLLS